MDKLYIIDASGYLYRSYHAIRQMTNSRGESTNAIFGFCRSLLKIIKDFSPNYIVAVFDGPQNTAKRRAIYPQYKAHRKTSPEDLIDQIYKAEEFCHLMGIPLLKVEKVEADDTMASVALWGGDHFDQTLICSSDKDMCQLVTDRTLLLHTHKDNVILGVKEVEEQFGVLPEQMRDYLAIVGDASDNIPGLQGFGPKTASELLREFGSLENVFQNIDKVPSKRQEAIKQGKEILELSQQLVDLDTHVAFPKEKSFFKMGEIDSVDLKKLFQDLGFNTFIREIEQLHLTPQQEDYRLVDDQEALNELVKLLKEVPSFGIDTETTDTNPMQAELVGIGICIEEGKAWYVPTNGNLGFDKVIHTLKPLLEDPSKSFWGHHMKYDYHVLQNVGITLSNIGFDTILASYIIQADTRLHNLDNLVLERFGKVKIPIDSLLGKGKKTVTMKKVPIEKVCLYCCEDIDYTTRLKNLFEKELKTRQLEELYYSIELPLLLVLAKMERRGIYVDIPYLKTMSEEANIKLKALEEEIVALAGEEFNLKSPKQLSEILFNKLQIKPPKKTTTGFSTNQDVLESLKNEYPIAKKLIEYRLLEKLRSTYIDSLPGEINPRTHRIHCSFNQSVAATGRLSSQNPNLQNIPIRSEIGRKIRRAFRPEKENHSFLSADYSQIELRLLAHLSEDPHLLEAFQQNEDIHRTTAASIFRIPLSQVTNEMRSQAKAVNFGVIYGQQAFGLSQELGISVSQAADFIQAYFHRFKRVKEFVEEVKESARKTEKTVTITGRERRIPEINSKNSFIRLQAERLAINTPLQGSGADLIKIAMLRVDQMLQEKKMKAALLLQIHDELLFELPNQEIDRLKPEVKKCMEEVWKLKVPLIVDIVIGKNWEEC